MSRQYIKPSPHVQVSGETHLPLAFLNLVLFFVETFNATAVTSQPDVALFTFIFPKLIMKKYEESFFGQDTLSIELGVPHLLPSVEKSSNGILTLTNSYKEENSLDYLMRQAFHVEEKQDKEMTKKFVIGAQACIFNLNFMLNFIHFFL